MQHQMHIDMQTNIMKFRVQFDMQLGLETAHTSNANRMQVEVHTERTVRANRHRNLNANPECSNAHLKHVNPPISTITRRVVLSVGHALGVG